MKEFATRRENKTTRRVNNATIGSINFNRRNVTKNSLRTIQVSEKHIVE
jgi:hypothetical protein